jgi:Uri superfamily endonuclease
MLHIPSDKGTYALHLQLSKSKLITIGKLGCFKFPNGEYLYVGSALGPGGLRSRLRRHLLGEKNFHWHIDYLRKDAIMRGCIYLISNQSYECQLSQTIMEIPGAYIPAPGFGSSDCHNCRAHLTVFTNSKVSGNLASNPEIQLNTIIEKFIRKTSIPNSTIKRFVIPA